MTNQDAIKYLRQLYPNGGHCWLDEQRIEAIRMAVKALQEEPAPKIFEDMLNAKTPAESLGISAEEHEKIIDLCLYGKEPEMVDIDDLPKEEPVSEELEEAAKRYEEDAVFYAGRNISDFFKAGAKWQKEHSFSDPQINENIIYAKGYKQAEKDSALTWEDIKKIGDLFQDVARDSRANKDLDASFKKDLDAPFKEILRRFLEQKGGKV